MSKFEFVPRVEIAALQDGGVLVTFDSASPDDRKRSPVAVRIPAYTQLSLHLEGFNELAETDAAPGARVFAGQVLLRTDAQGLTPLSEIEWLIDAGDAPLAADLRATVREGLAEAFGTALERLGALLEARASAQAAPAAVGGAVTLPAPQAVSGATVMPFRSSGRAAAPKTSPDKRSRMSENKLLLTIVAGGPLLVLLLWGLGKMLSGPSVPAMPTAMAQASGYDPAAAEAQIELTKQTLRDMGLDPGDGAADLGCLVQPTQ